MEINLYNNSSARERLEKHGISVIREEKVGVKPNRLGIKYLYRVTINDVDEKKANEILKEVQFFWIL